jgi:tRNA G10  N-methylase Trm11
MVDFEQKVQVRTVCVECSKVVSERTMTLGQWCGYCDRHEYDDTSADKFIIWHSGCASCYKAEFGEELYGDIGVNEQSVA